MRIRSIAMPVLAAAVIGTIAFGATASASDQADGPNSVNSTHVQDNSLLHTDLKDGYGVVGADVADGSLSRNDLQPAWATLFDNRALDVETDGPYPGRTDSQNNLHELGNPKGSEGAQSTALWAPGPGLRASWVMCAPGKIALGGGFGDNDTDDSKIRVTTSAPVQIRKTQAGPYEQYYAPRAGDAAGSFVPNGWLVEGHNEGTEATMVRPHVICVKVG